MKKSLIKQSLFSLHKEMRLCGKQAIKEVFKKGRRYSFQDAVLFVLPNGVELSRFLCTFRRGFGCAVMRNRTRRIAKEVYRHSQHSIKKGFDLVFLPSKYCDDFYKMKDKIEHLFCMANLIE